MNLCQCPTAGFFHFYILKTTDIHWLIICVNALQRASSISTWFKSYLLSFNRMCQCPTAGFFHFYRDLIIFQRLSDMCQCPTAGFFHFYEQLDSYRVEFEICVNALQRASSISTIYYSGAWIHGSMCQCPTAGFFHFYPDLWNPLILRGCRSQFCKPISVSVKKRVKMTIFLVFRKNSLFTSVIYHLSKWLYFLLKHLYYNTFFYHLHYYSSFFLIFVVLS